MMKKTHNLYRVFCILLIVTVIAALAIYPTLAAADPDQATPSASAVTEDKTSPSADASAEPSEKPSAEPSAEPSATPSTEPSVTPSAAPSTEPSVSPSAEPSVNPSAEPSVAPSAAPSTSPTETPVVEEDKAPSYYPASKPYNVGAIKQSVKNSVISKAAAASLSVASTGYVSPGTDLNLNKTASVFSTDSSGRSIFKLDLTATTTSHTVINVIPCDIVMVLDCSSSMNDSLPTYTAVSSAGSGTYYVKVYGIYYKVTKSGANWTYSTGGATYYVTFSATGDDNSPGSNNASTAVAKKFYTASSGSTTKLDALKTAAKNFASSVLSNSPDSNIAVVSFASSADIKTGLVPVKGSGTSVNNAITNAINGLSTNGYTYVNQGLEKAVSIFHSDTTTNNRVVVLFTDGEPGILSFQNYPTECHQTAAAAINQAAILKAPKTNTSVSSNVNFDGTQSGAVSGATGCGATVYTIGVFPSDVNQLVHRYMAWVSSDSAYTATSCGATSPSGCKYYFTADSSSSLDAIFESISQETGTTLNGVAIRDYIDPRFNVVDSSGNTIEVGGSVTISGVTGTVKSDATGIYVEWTKNKIEPGTLADGKGFEGWVYVRPKDDFIGGNNVPTNVPNSTAIYVNNVNSGSFPNPLVNVPFKLTLGTATDYIFIGETVPRSEATAADDLITENITTLYGYPSNLLGLAWSPDFATSDKPQEVKTYTLTATATPKNYMDTSAMTPVSTGVYKLSTGEIYYVPPTGNPVATALSKTGTYTVRPVRPTFTGSTYNIFLGETAGDGGATTLADAVSVAMPDTDVSGTTIASAAKTTLAGRLNTYAGAFTYGVSSVTSGAPAYANPLSGYKPVDDTTLSVDASYGGVKVNSDAVPVIVKVTKGKLVITKNVSGTSNPNETFVFEIKQYSDTGKTTLVKTFYETIRVSGSSNSVTVINLPKGCYTVTEKSDWSWQYTPGDTNKTDTLGMTASGTRDITKTTAAAAFTNTSKKINWLYDIDWAKNIF